NRLLTQFLPFTKLLRSVVDQDVRAGDGTAQEGAAEIDIAVDGELIVIGAGERDRVRVAGVGEIDEVDRVGREGDVPRGGEDARRSEEHTSELQSRGHLV